MSDQPKRVTVGRRQGNTIILPNPDVSGDHAVLTLKEPSTNTWEIQDLGSRNGTFVDGQRILSKEITPKNKVVFGSTPLAWNQVIDVPKTKEKLLSIKGLLPIKELLPERDKKKAVSFQDTFKPLAETEEQRLKRIYEEYISKRSQLEDIQRNEALNARYQSLGIPFAALCAGSAAFVPPELRYISIIGSVISMLIAGWSFFNSKKYAQEKRELNMTKITEQYDIHYRCPHCRIKLTDPFPVLVQIKNCRNCKKPLIND
ncbi:FHA domain-containing protein [Dyadobacter sp. CY261]|uniref:FHA domain-containing protein n=1 Tax=Dyadobacter sp. CY261 TaxID=2907203 RepID=UPI001F34C8CA|nr:FHA domain-containing protein [Dyadobacter sp. CY261]MCF0075090.1 FHA domain-containing protein [Dyadobacter sp. CY261]